MVIMSFEDKSICESIYSLLLFYIDSYPITEPEKIKCKCFLEQFLVGFLEWVKPLKYSLSEQFDEEKFYAKLNGNEEEVDIKSWTT